MGEDTSSGGPNTSASTRKLVAAVVNAGRVPEGRAWDGCDRVPDWGMGGRSRDIQAWLRASLALIRSFGFRASKRLMNSRPGVLEY